MMRYPQQSDSPQAQPLDSWNAPTIPLQSVIDARLAEIQQASRAGDRDRAYRLSEEVTELAPDSVEGWIYRAAFTTDHDQRFTYLNKALSLSPDHVHARHGMYETLKVHLEHDPFLRYIEENEVLYRAMTGEGRAINVPKDRTAIPAYPPKEPPPLNVVFRWFFYSLAGLLLAGLVTVVAAPVTMVRAWRILQQPSAAMNHRRAAIALFFAGILWLVGLSLSFLFVLHVLAY